MATAIFRGYTKDDFVVASDGRMRNSETGEIWDNTQKVFRFGPSKSLAYSFTGQIELTPVQDNHKVVLDFISQVRETVESIAPGGLRTLAKYAERFSELVCDALKRAQRTHEIRLPEDPSLVPGERGCTIASILIDGYYEGWPSRVNVRFYC